MSRYDWSWNRGYDRAFRPRPMRGYGSDFGDRGGGGWWRWGGNPAGGWPAPSRGGWGPPRYERYDRYDRGFAPRGGSWGRARGYDRPLFREPFVPEPLYHQSEADEPVRTPADPWSTQHQGFELTDEEIRGAVRQNLFNDNWIDAERIQVEVAEQVVTLTGEVDDYLEARYAWDDAWEAVGVRGVINQLTVRNEPAPRSETRAPAKQGKKK